MDLYSLTVNLKLKVSGKLLNVWFNVRTCYCWERVERLRPGKKKLKKRKSGS